MLNNQTWKIHKVCIKSKFTRHSKKQKIWPVTHSQKKNQSIETDSEIAQTIELAERALR